MRLACCKTSLLLTSNVCMYTVYTHLYQKSPSGVQYSVFPREVSCQRRNGTIFCLSFNFLTSTRHWIYRSGTHTTLLRATVTSAPVSIVASSIFSEATVARRICRPDHGCLSTGNTATSTCSTGTLVNHFNGNAPKTPTSTPAPAYSFF